MGILIHAFYLARLAQTQLLRPGREPGQPVRAPAALGEARPCFHRRAFAAKTMQ